MKSFWHILSEVSQPWAVTGGANHYMRRVVDHLNDVDIITTQMGGYEISQLLGEYNTLPFESRITEAVESFFARYRYLDREIEVMGDPVNFVNGAWRANTRWKKHIERHDCNNCKVFLTSMEYEIYIYELLGNNERFSLLKAHCLTSQATRPPTSQPLVPRVDLPAASA